ncbi:MAG: hypothetical protein IJ566_02430 [Cardiobacteriaceae bacterium]|nr:hypothetical protein [Cardiobacteriaceae bacterium]
MEILFIYQHDGSSIFSPRHPERSEGSTDRDFSPTAQNDEFLDTPTIYLRTYRTVIFNL